MFWFQTVHNAVAERRLIPKVTSGNLMLAFPELERDPESDARWRYLCTDLTQKKTYSRWKSLLKNFLYSNCRTKIWTCRALKERSWPSETKSTFQIRHCHAACEARDLQVAKIRFRYASRFRTLEDRIRREE